MDNFTAVANEMAAAGAAFTVTNEASLADSIARLLSDREARDKAASEGFAIATGKEGILDAVMQNLEPLLAQLPAGTSARS
jgi:3-deoxy-D-manno-octulosonic-acid transferase